MPSFMSGLHAGMLATMGKRWRTLDTVADLPAAETVRIGFTLADGERGCAPTCRTLLETAGHLCRFCLACGFGPPS